MLRCIQKIERMKDYQRQFIIGMKEDKIEQSPDQIFNVISIEREHEGQIKKQATVVRRLIEKERSAKKTKKSRRKIYEKWSIEDQKIYWFGLMAMVEQNPLVKHSWLNWKVDRCFKNMQTLFKGSKTNTQIKSFDQRMKKQFQKAQKTDLQQAICKALKQFKLTQHQQQRLQKFQKFCKSQRNVDTQFDARQFLKQFQNSVRNLKNQIIQTTQICNVLTKQKYKQE